MSWDYLKVPGDFSNLELKGPWNFDPTPKSQDLQTSLCPRRLAPAPSRDSPTVHSFRPLCQPSSRHVGANPDAVAEPSPVWEKPSNFRAPLRVGSLKRSFYKGSLKGSIRALICRSFMKKPWGPLYASYFFWAYRTQGNEVQSFGLGPGVWVLGFRCRLTGLWD